jgi:hypothetical protein
MRSLAHLSRHGDVVTSLALSFADDHIENVSDIDTGVLDSLKVLDPDGRLEKRT